ncbi:MAG: hypothetical protein ACREMC_05470 [Gemmatimonadales bacterium]
MKRVMQDERGIALAVAIFALVIVGALVAGALFTGTQEQRVAENSRRLQQSFGLAELGIGEHVANWDPGTYNITPIHPAGSLAIPATGSQTGVFGGSIRKLNGNLYLIDIMAQDSTTVSADLRTGGARQRIGLIARIMPFQIPIQASLTTQGGASLSGNAVVDGRDQIPPGWMDCDPTGAAAAGIRVNGPVTTSGNAAIIGSPPVRQDTTITDSTFTDYGDTDYLELAAMASITLPAGTYQTQPSVTGTTCDKSVLTNWGDGLNKGAPCANYFPIIHITGTVTLNGVQGQGILLVDGDLNVQGSYEFFGVTVVRGRLQTAGGGSTDAHFWGGVLAQNVDLNLQSLSGKATLNYSRCAIVQALQMTGKVGPMVSRGWAQLF